MSSSSKSVLTARISLNSIFTVNTTTHMKKLAILLVLLSLSFAGYYGLRNWNNEVYIDKSVATKEMRRFQSLDAALEAVPETADVVYIPDIHGSPNMGLVMTRGQIKSFMDNIPRTLADGLAAGYNEEATHKYMQYSGATWVLWQ